MLICNGYILDDQVGGAKLVRKDIRILNNGIISAIDDALSPEPGEEVLFADNRFVMPGMVNSHYHSYSNLLKGTSTGEPLEIWACDTVALGHAMNRDYMRISAQLGIVEMLRSGVTSCLDHIPHLAYVDTIAETYADANFRASIAPMIADISDDQILADFGVPLGRGKTQEESEEYVQEIRHLYENWVEKWHTPKSTMQIVCGINAPQRASHQALEAAREIEEKYDLGIHAHVLETCWQATSAQKLQEDPLEKLDQHGLLLKKTGLAHCVWLSERQLDKIASKNSTIILNPTSNMFLGSGTADLIGIIRRGIPAAIGTDGSNCATGQNLLECIRASMLLPRIGQRDYEKWPTIQDTWQMATKVGAEACGWENLGQLKVGSRADIVLVDISGVEYWPANHFLLQILLYVGKLDVTDVLIQGKCVMRNRKVLCLDEENLMFEARKVSTVLPDAIETALQKSRGMKEAYKQAYAKHYKLSKGEKPNE